MIDMIEAKPKPKEKNKEKHSPQPINTPVRREIRHEPSNYDYPPDSRGDIYIPEKGWVI